ncbi:MAG: glycerophosphodiester phosphodiesterase [Candidatus Thorarchaeota archaeon]
MIIAHRGASSIAPPNTLKSFQKAIDLKADYIEFDIHKSLDGEIVIKHDAYINDLTGQKQLIKDMVIKDLKALDVGEGEKIPTLKELIKLTKCKIGLQCEIKAPGLSKDLVEMLSQENLIETSIISSFMFHELLELQKINSELKLALLIPPEIPSARRLMKICQKAIDNNFYAVHPHFKSINIDVVRTIHNEGLLVNVWTVNKESDIREVLKMGINGIISDDINLVKNVLNDV